MKRMNDQGLTLVELLCSLALLAIVGLAGLAMMGTVARMNHVVALQEKQAREAQVLIETVKHRVGQNKGATAVSEDNTETPECGQITFDESDTVQFAVKDEEGRQDLTMQVGQAEATMVATDIKDFSVGQEGSAIVIRLIYANDNTFEWVITPRM